MGGDADLVDDVGDHGFERGLGNHAALEGGFGAADLTGNIQYREHITGLGHEVGGAQCGAFRCHGAVDECCDHDHRRAYACFGQSAQHLCAGQGCEHQLRKYHVGLVLGNQLQCFQTVACVADDLHIALVVNHIGEQHSVFRIGICYQYAHLGFHCKINPPKTFLSGKHLSLFTGLGVSLTSSYTLICNFAS